ncbi:unnamed protein product [Discosporangium mesarthrocarpum]
MITRRLSDKDDPEFETTVDWDAELRKLNAGELDGPRPRGWDDFNEAEKMQKRVEGKVKSNVRKAQDAIDDVLDETSYKMRGAIRKAPRWQQLSRDWRFWVGVVAFLSLVTSLISASSRQDLMVMTDGNPFPGATMPVAMWTAMAMFTGVLEMTS